MFPLQLQTSYQGGVGCEERLACWLFGTIILDLLCVQYQFTMKTSTVQNSLSFTGEIRVENKTFTECSHSGVLKAPDSTECCDKPRVLRSHHLSSAPVTTGTSLLQLSHPYLPVDIVLTSVKSLYTRESDY